MVDRGAARSRAQALAFRLAPREMDPEVHVLVDRAKALRRAIVLGTLPQSFLEELWEGYEVREHPGAEGADL
eukprot:10073924-Alexandrium_andersonii.AAC.1